MYCLKLQDVPRVCPLTAGGRGHQSSPAGHPAPLHQLARLRGAVLPHRHAEVPEEGEDGEPLVRGARGGALQVSPEGVAGSAFK